MKTAVIDTSALIAVIANEPEKSRLVALTNGYTLIAPRSVYWEIGNAFSAMLKRGRITIRQVEAALDAFDAIPVRYVELGLREAVKISEQYNIYAYDAYLLAAAFRYKSPLLSLDRQMIRLGDAVGIQMLEV
ncbi:MAG TPA: type II toxin-antitoxin system VapC family toxin [Tichowtungia sp.]|nr:type II toxin-antitoxin system VapC family toxin [Tichowtungia sp.]